MADIDKVRSQVRSQVRSRLNYTYPETPDDEDGSIDRTWINKKQKYEVDYAIAECLIDCKATFLATNTKVVRKLEEMIQNMNHDGMGRCERQKAYPALCKIIRQKRLKKIIYSLISK